MIEKKKFQKLIKNLNLENLELNTNNTNNHLIIDKIKLNSKFINDKLWKLDLTDIGINSLENVFIDFKNLRWLSLSDNNIKKLSSNMFRSLHNLEILYLNNNALTELPAGIFKNLTNLRVLDLSGNNLKLECLEQINIGKNLTKLKLYNNELPIPLNKNLENREELNQYLDEVSAITRKKHEAQKKLTEEKNEAHKKLEDISQNLNEAIKNENIYQYKSLYQELRSILDNYHIKIEETSLDRNTLKEFKIINTEFKIKENIKYQNIGKIRRLLKEFIELDTSEFDLSDKIKKYNKELEIIEKYEQYDKLSELIQFAIKNKEYNKIWEPLNRLIELNPDTKYFNNRIKYYQSVYDNWIIDKFKMMAHDWKHGGKKRVHHPSFSDLIRRSNSETKKIIIKLISNEKIKIQRLEGEQNPENYSSMYWVLNDNFYKENQDYMISIKKINLLKYLVRVSNGILSIDLLKEAMEFKTKDELFDWLDRSEISYTEDSSNVIVEM